MSVSDLIPEHAYHALSRYQREGLEQAIVVWNEHGQSVPQTCGTVISRGKLAGVACRRVAGQGTGHLGYGKCVAHGGAKRLGRAEGAWMAAHAFAQELDVNPWDALLMAVRIAAGKVAYCQWVLGRATHDLEIEGRLVKNEDGGLLVHPDTGEPLGAGALRDLTFWNTKLEFWHGRMAQTAKWAIDAGVAAWQVEKMQGEAQAIVSVLNNVIAGVQDTVGEEVVAEMRRLMRRELLALDEAQGSIRASTDADSGVVDSTWQEGGG